MKADPDWGKWLEASEVCPSITPSLLSFPSDNVFKWPMWMGDNRVILGKFPDFLRLDAISISLSFSAYPIVSAPPDEEDGKTLLFL